MGNNGLILVMVRRKYKSRYNPQVLVLIESPVPESKNAPKRAHEILTALKFYFVRREMCRKLNG